MTAETLHDALTLLPADLIAETDKKRNCKPVRFHWQRWAAMAACLAVILCFGLLLGNKLLPGSAKSASAEISLQYAADNCAPEEAAEAPAAGAAAESGSTTAAPAQAVPPLQDSAVSAGTPDQGIRCVNTPDNLYTTACRVHGPEVVLISSREALDAYLDNWDLDYFLDELRTACEGYDDVWFESHDLVLIPVYPVSADGGVTVTEVTETEDALEVHIAVSQPNADAECTTWHILLETGKGLLSDADAVTVVSE
ncbi:MAG: hypothetical protein ACI4PH_08365 [Faecousia sp.]